jgi:Peptidase family M1 domain
MRRWLPMLVPLLVLLAAGGAALDGQRARNAPRPRPRPAATAPAARAPEGRVAAAPPSTAPAPGALSPRNANYLIEARLDSRQRMITGREWLTWRNITGSSTSELRYHLYYNGFKNSRSTWLRERALAGRISRPLSSLREKDWGWTEVTTIRLVGEGGSPPIDLSGQRRFIAPDDGNVDDETVMAVALPRPVAPGETINVYLEWTAQVPRTFSRTGAIGDFFFLGQWFPKIGVLQEDGWNCHQFHASTEFFSDYGIYDVKLTVPKGWVVGATGLERETTDNPDATTTHRFYQEDVHDFAWTTSPSYLVRQARFEQPGLPPVDMRLLLQPEHADQAERHFAATRAALRYYGQWFGPYPYPHITIVDPAWQSGAGGMEYPTLFTAGTSWIAPADVADPEGVTVHECGHQFWYAIVGNNEFEDAWLDEGLNTFSTGRTMALAFSPNDQSTRLFGGFVPVVWHDLPVSREVDEDGLASYRAGAKLDAQSTPSWRYWPGAGGALSYSKTALWLNTLERHLGWSTLQRIMSTFFARWKFRHPKPADFFAVVNEVSGRDMTWFFDQVYRSSNVFDYEVADLQSAPVTASGFFDAKGQPEYKAENPSPGRFRTTVVVRRLGEGLFPVDVQVTFRNGERVRERWDGRDRWKLFTYDRATDAVSAQVDPDRVLLLDIDYTNNSRTLEPRGGEAATKWALKWMAWLQDLLLTAAFFV